MTDEQSALAFLCKRLGRNPDDTETGDTLSVLAAVRAMVAWAELARERALDEGMEP